MPRSVVILDDEQLIVQTLTAAIPWRALGCAVAGSAGSGAEGRALIDAVRPDIVLTDIIMPGMTGLELVEWCAARHPAARFILLSAHSEFAYAQKAMSFGVAHYVLKPIDTRQLMQAVRALCKELDARDARENREDSLRALAENSRTLASASLLFSIARYGREVTPQEKSLLLQVGTFAPSVLAAVRFFNTAAGEGLLGDARRIYQQQLAGAGYAVTWGSLDDGLIFLCPLPGGVPPGLARQRAAALLERIGRALPPRLGIAVAAVSEVYRDLDGLHRCYGQCLAQLRRGFFCDAPAVLTAPPPAGPAEEPADAGLVLHHLRHGNAGQLLEELERWRACLVRQNDALRAVYALRELHRAATREAAQAGMAEKPAVEQGRQNENFSAMFAALRSYLAGICAYVAQSQSLAGRLQLLIGEGYGDPGLNLTALADAVGVNSSYLSRLFKKEFGENFSEYLLRVRIGRACFLLRSTPLKNAEIARQVGFEDDHYFGQVFKKRMGCTPGQYRGAGGAKSYPPG